MKKIILTIAAVAGLVCFSQAQTTSANIVGYAKITATGGELSLVALNFSPSSTTVADLIGDQLPSSSVVHIWNKASGSYSTVVKGRFGWGAGSINLGDAFWIEASGTDTHEIILSGDVNTTATNSSTLPAGVEATGLFYPVETTFGATDLAANLPSGSVVHFWNEGTQSYQTFPKGRFGWGQASSQVISPTSGFWVETAGTFSWDETRPFTF